MELKPLCTFHNHTPHFPPRGSIYPEFIISYSSLYFYYKYFVPVCLYSKCMNLLQLVLLTHQFVWGGGGGSITSMNVHSCSSCIFLPGELLEHNRALIYCQSYICPLVGKHLSLSLSLQSLQTILPCPFLYVSPLRRVSPESPPGRGTAGL